MSKNILFLSVENFKKRVPSSKLVDDLQIQPFIKLAQDMYILPCLGSALYNRLQTGVDEDNLTTNEEKLLNEYITDSLQWHTMSMLPMGMGYQLFSKGFLQKTSDESVTPSRSDLELIENKYKDYAEFYSKRLVLYLQENYTLHYEYLNPGSGVDTIFPKTNVYTCPIYLGDKYEKKNPLYINSASGSSLTPVYYTPSIGVASFTVDEIGTRSVKVSSRSGLAKTIVNQPTTNPNALQINGKVVTLPTGDLTVENEYFIFLCQ